MSSIASLATLYFFIIALPLGSVATPTTVHRVGAKNDPVGGAIRAQDWHMAGDTVHPHDSKGLSMNVYPPGTPTNKKQKVWSMNDQSVSNHPEFKVKHDAGQSDGAGGIHPPGHATLAYKGPAVHKDELKAKIKNLPWNKRSLGEHADDRRFTDRVYRRIRLEQAYQRALEDLEDLD